MVAAFVAAFLALRAELKRRKLTFSPDAIMRTMAMAGMLAAKLWHVIAPPADRLTLYILGQPISDLPAFIAGTSWLRGPATFLLNFFGWFREGFAWFGGFVAGIATLVILARKYRINWLNMLDIASPAAAIGYAVGRIGCLISGDGDYGQ